MPKTPPATPQFAPSAPPLANTGVSHDPLGAIPPAIIWVEALGAGGHDKVHPVDELGDLLWQHEPGTGPSTDHPGEPEPALPSASEPAEKLAAIGAKQIDNLANTWFDNVLEIGAMFLSIRSVSSK